MKFPRVIDCVAVLALIGMLVLVSGAVDHYKVANVLLQPSACVDGA
jgi:hypothetical protein